MWLQEQLDPPALIPPPVNYRRADGAVICNFHLNPEAMTAAGYHNWTDEEVEAWHEAHPAPPPPERTIFTKLAIRRAMRQLGIEAKLDNLLNASAQFRADWNDAQEIDLADPVLVAALGSGSITEAEIAQIKQLAGGEA